MTRFYGSDSSDNDRLRTELVTQKSAKDILTHILQTEEEIKLFCEANNINTKNQHIFTLGTVSKIFLEK